MADLAVLVLNWNGARWLEPCFQALLAQTGPCFEPWLVDNGSSDGSLELMQARFPQVHVLPLPANIGFGAAYDLAIAAANTPVVALLNNDTQVQPGWLAALVDELEARPNAAAVGGKLLYLDRPGVINHAGGGLTLLGAGYDIGFGQRDSNGDGPRPVGCVTGAAMLLRRDAFLEVGGFDDSYFAYFEDADLCWRWWLRGYELRYTPRARVLHAYGGTTGMGRLSPLRIEHCQTNRLQNMFKNLELATLLRVLPLSVLYDQMRVAELWRRGHRAAARAYVRGTRRFLRLLPHALRERRPVQAGRLRSDQELVDKGVLTGVVAAAMEWQRIGSL